VYEFNVQEKAVVVANKEASRVRENLPHALQVLSGRLSIEVSEPPTNEDYTRKLKARMSGADRIIVAGGDGTLHHMLPLLLEQGKPFGILPFGTANDFARSIGVPPDINVACDIASGNTFREIDIGTLNGAPFFNVASLGVASAISRLQTSERKRQWRVLSYAVSLFQAVRNVKPFRASITSDKHPDFKGYVLQTSVGNGRYHGGGLTSGPDAEIDDGLLHVYTVAATRWWQLIHVVPALLLGLHKWASSVDSFNARRCVIKCRSPQRATVDGELLDEKQSTYVFEVHNAALRVYAPPQRSGIL